MYWRDLYPTHAAAIRAGQLGDLGKLKLSAEQKSAINAAKADAKVKAAQAKASEKVAKITRKTQIRDARTQTKIARTNAARDKHMTTSAIAASDQTALNVAAQFDPSMLPMSFSSGGGGGGSSPTPYEAPALPVADDGTIFGFPPMVLFGAGALLLFLVLRK